MVGRAGWNAFGSVQAVMLKTHVPRPQPELSETARKKPELEHDVRNLTFVQLLVAHVGEHTTSKKSVESTCMFLQPCCSMML